MKRALFFCCLVLAVGASAQTKVPTLRSILLAQFQSTYNKEDWFVPVMTALQGVTPKQASWKPTDSCHSIGELAYHLLYWDTEQLDDFTGKKRPAFSGNNNETFTRFTEASWDSTVLQLGQVLKSIETIIKTSDDRTLQKLVSAVAHISAHNAYHTGQIIYVRKLQGSWDASKGVK